MASTGRHARLVAEETGHDTAGRQVLEQEMSRAQRGRQHLRDQVEVDRREESYLFGLPNLVLVEGGVVALNTGILHARAGERAAFERQPVLPGVPGVPGVPF